jgi:hypothetical protein
VLADIFSIIIWYANVYVDDLVRNVFCKSMTPRWGSLPDSRPVACECNGSCVCMAAWQADTVVWAELTVFKNNL